MEQKQGKINYVSEDDTCKVVKLMIRTSAEGELPMKFEPWYMAVAKEIPDDIVEMMVNREVRRMMNSMANCREWGEYIKAKKAYCKEREYGE